MSRLLRANFARLKKNNPFWICIAVMAFTGGFFTFTQRNNVNLDQYFFTYCICIGVASSFFGSMFIGTHYSCGTIRNKLNIGNKRLWVYLSDLVTVYAASLIFCAVSALSSFGELFILQGGFTHFSAAEILTAAACSAFSILSYSALFTAISELVTGKAASAVSCIMLAYFLLFSGIYIVSRLEEPMIIPKAYYVNEKMDMELIPEHPNPLYVDGVKRSVYEALEITLPGAQGFYLMYHTGNAEVMENYIPKASLCSFIAAAAATSAGVFLFSRKDLK